MPHDARRSEFFQRLADIDRAFPDPDAVAVDDDDVDYDDGFDVDTSCAELSALATLPRASDPRARASAESAYRVPWRIDRERAPWYTLHNTGSETLSGVHLTLQGDGRLLWQPLRRVGPRGQLTFVLRADEPERDCIATLRWFRPSGDEYLWRLAF